MHTPQDVLLKELMPAVFSLLFIAILKRKRAFRVRSNDSLRKAASSPCHSNGISENRGELISGSVSRVASPLAGMAAHAILNHRKINVPMDGTSVKSISSRCRDTSDGNMELRARQLSQWLSNVSFFSNLSPSTRLQLCKHISLEVFEPGQIVFAQGDEADKFYVVQSGSIIIWKQDDAAPHPASSTGASKPTPEPPPASATAPNTYKPANAKAEQKNTIVIATLSSGQTFGEMALLSNKPRSASVSAKERSVLLVIMKSDYDALIKRVHERSLEDRVHFLRRLPMFRRWAELNLKHVSVFLNATSCQRGQTVVKQGDKANGVFFIQDGECKVVVQLLVPRTGPASPHATTHPDALLTPRAVSRRWGALSSKSCYELSVLGPGEYFGDVPTLQGEPYPFSVVASSQLTLLSFSKSDFLRHVARNRDSVATMTKVDNDRTLLRQNRIQGMLQAVPSYVSFKTSTRRPSRAGLSSVSPSLSDPPVYLRPSSSSITIL